jgi:hypothetical protein
VFMLLSYYYNYRTHITYTDKEYGLTAIP